MTHRNRFSTVTTYTQRIVPDIVLIPGTLSLTKSYRSLTCCLVGGEVVYVWWCVCGGDGCVALMEIVAVVSVCVW